MKAIILAAGKGERLKDITKVTPKPMISYRGKPVLQYNIELCKKNGITDIFINVHHHADQIKEYFGNGEKWGVDIKYSYEEKLLGTSGAVRKIAHELWNYPIQNSNISSFRLLDPFFVIYGDQISEFDFNLLITKYRQHDCLGVIAFHYREEVKHSGVAEFDNEFKIQRFIEKPKKGETESHWVNVGIYFINPLLLLYIPEGFSDFGKQIFPAILKKNKSFFGVCKRNEVKVFDTPDMYKKTMEVN
jgi:NDP-sugar pyrophosphorylase family protein